MKVMSILQLSQNDPRWSADKLGQSDLTIAKFGCTSVSLSMLSDFYDCYLSPPQIAHNVNNYTKDGLIIWQNLNFERMRFVRREYGHNDFNIQHALNALTKAVILQVNNGQHWVVAVKKNLLGRDYTIIDPWDGKKKNCLASYKNITGAAYFESKVPMEPPSKVDVMFGKKLGERDYPFFIAVQDKGALWYVHPDGSRQYLSPENIISFIQTYSTGISNDDLEKVPIKK